MEFPLFEKIEVNGEGQHPLYQQLNAVPDGEGYTGDIRWNFEKFLVSPRARSSAGSTRPSTPEDPALVAAIEEQIPG